MDAHADAASNGVNEEPAAAPAAAGEPRAEGPPAEETPEQSALAALQADVERLQSEREHLADQVLRLRADFENYKRRTAQESQAMRDRASESVIVRMLPVVDNLERAVQAARQPAEGGTSPSERLIDGVAMVLRQLHEMLDDEGVAPIESVGRPFNPQEHEAVGRVNGDGGHKPGHVVEELQRGYRLGDRILRPSTVTVAAGDE